MSLFERQMAEGRLRALLPQWRRKVAKAGTDVVVMARRFPNSYAAVSWGKQSIVMAHLIHKMAPEIPAVHFTGEDAELIADFQDVRDQFSARFPMPYRERWREKSLREAIAAYVAETEPDGVFVGLCASESRARRMTLRRGDANNIYRYKGGMARCCPLADWTDDDIGAYIAVHDLPVLRPYRRFGLSVRTSTGSRPGSHTEGAIELMSSANAAELRRRWKERGWR